MFELHYSFFVDVAYTLVYCTYCRSFPHIFSCKIKRFQVKVPKNQVGNTCTDQTVLTNTRIKTSLTSCDIKTSWRQRTRRTSTVPVSSDWPLRNSPKVQSRTGVSSPEVTAQSRFDILWEKKVSGSDLTIYWIMFVHYSASRITVSEEIHSQNRTMICSGQNSLFTSSACVLISEQ